MSTHSSSSVEPSFSDADDGESLSSPLSELSELSDADLDSLLASADPVLPLEGHLPKSTDMSARMALASRYLDDAFCSRSPRHHTLPPSSYCAFATVHRVCDSLVWQLFLSAALLCLLCLVYWESPSHLAQRSVAHSSVSFLGPALCQLAVAALFLAHSLVGLVSVGWRRAPPRTAAVVALCLLLALDAAIGAGVGPQRYYRATRWLRPLLLILHYEPLRASAALILAASRRLAVLAFLGLVLLAVAAAIGTRLFYGAYVTRGVGSTYWYRFENFNTFARSAQLLFLTLTRKSSPTVMWPSVVFNVFGAPFFAVFVSIANVLFLPAVVAVLTSAFQSERKTRALRQRVAERRSQCAAFRILQQSGNGLPLATATAALAHCRAQSSALCRHRLRPETLRHLPALFAHQLAPHTRSRSTSSRSTSSPSRNSLTVYEWFLLCDLATGVRARALSSPPAGPPAAPPPPLPCRPPAIRWAASDAVAASLSAVALAAVCASPVPYSGQSRTPYTVVFLLCLAAQILAFALRQLSRTRTAPTDSNPAVLEAALLAVIALAEVATAIPAIARTMHGADDIFRSLIGLHLALCIRPARAYLLVLWHALLASSVSLFTLSALLFYSFAVIGCELFAGRLGPALRKLLNPAINWDTFTRANICQLYLTGFANWPQIASIATEHSAIGEWAVLYFLVFDLVVVIVLLSLATSLFLEAHALYRGRLLSGGTAAVSGARRVVVSIDGTRYEVFIGRERWARDVVRSAGLELDGFARHHGPPHPQLSQSQAERLPQ